MAKSNRKSSKHPARVNPISIFGSPPIIPGEDESAYDEILLRATSALKLADIIEEMLLDDIVRPTWDIIRFRRLQNALLNFAAHKALERVLEPLVKRSAFPHSTPIDREIAELTLNSEAEELALGWRAQGRDAQEEVATRLKEAKLSMDEVMAEALALRIAETTAIDSLIQAAEDRRYTALRELDRRRAMFANRPGALFTMSRHLRLKPSVVTTK